MHSLLWSKALRSDAPINDYILNYFAHPLTSNKNGLKLCLGTNKVAPTKIHPDLSGYPNGAPIFPPSAKNVFCAAAIISNVHHRYNTEITQKIKA